MGVSVPAPVRPAAVIWHELECASYDADLALWSELADDHPDTPILDVGAGSGRVAAHLARRGRAVIALDSEPLLLAELTAKEPDLPIQAVCADARDFRLDAPAQVGLCLAPMQTVQLLGGDDGRIAFLGALRAHLRPGGLAALAIVCDLEPFDCRDGSRGPTAETLRVGEVTYRSRATRVALEGQRIVIERQRTIFAAGRTVSGERDVVILDRLSAEQLAGEAASVGLHPAGTRTVDATSEHTSSTVVLLHG